MINILRALKWLTAGAITQPIEGMRTRRIYVCHPFGDNPDDNMKRVLALCRTLIDSGYLPIAPQVYLPQFMDEATERERAISLCLELVGVCDEVRVYGDRITAGMRKEIDYAKAHAIPVRIIEVA